MAHYALKKQPRTRTLALSDTVCVRADGSTYTIPRTKTRSSKLSEAELLRRAKERQRERDNRRIDIINARDRGKTFTSDTRFAPIGNID